MADLDLIETVEETKYDQFNFDAFAFNLDDEMRNEMKHNQVDKKVKAFRRLYGEFNLYCE